jgi:hypothetical protein
MKFKKKIKMRLIIFIKLFRNIYTLKFSPENLENIRHDVWHRTIIALIFPVWVFFIYCGVVLVCIINEIRVEDAKSKNLIIEKMPMKYYLTNYKEFLYFLERIFQRYNFFLKKEIPKFILTTILSIIGFNLITFLILNVIYRLW